MVASSRSSTQIQWGTSASRDEHEKTGDEQVELNSLAWQRSPQAVTVADVRHGNHTVPRHRPHDDPPPPSSHPPRLDRVQRVPPPRRGQVHRPQLVKHPPPPA